MTRVPGAVIHRGNDNDHAKAEWPPAPEKVFSIRTVNPRFRTKEGVCVGGRYDAAKASLGKPSYYDEMPGLGARAAWKSGLWVDVDMTGKIVIIGIDFNHGLLLFR